MVGTLFKIRLKSTLREPATLFFFFFLPILYSLLFGFGSRLGERPPKIAVLTEGGQQEFVDAISTSDEFEVTVLDRRSEIDDAFDRARLDAVSIVQRGAVVLLFDEVRTEKLTHTATELEGFIEKFNSRGGRREDAVRLNIQGRRGPRRPAFEYSLPGLLLFVVLLPAISTGAASTTAERQAGVHKRFMVTPLNGRTYFLSDLAARATLSALQVVVVLGIGSALFDLQLAPHFAWTIPIAIGGVVTFISLGYAVASVSSNPEAVSGIAGVFSFLLLFASGGFPQSLLPPGVAEAVKSLPLRPVTDALLAIVLDESGPWKSAPRATVLVFAWSLGLFLLATLVFRFREPARKD